MEKNLEISSLLVQPSQNIPHCSKDSSDTWGHYESVGDGGGAAAWPQIHAMGRVPAIALRIPHLDFASYNKVTDHNSYNQAISNLERILLNNTIYNIY